MSNQVERNKPDNTQQDSLSTKGRWPVFIKLFAVCGVTSALGEIIGTFKVPVGPGSLIILPMIFAMILAVLITPDALEEKLRRLKKYAVKRKLSCLRTL